ncbi:DoxX family protein [Chitinophaga vietnamensis]|uniref:DoxX family protein n=1 Tax=Chitinophaga vietnamensis TaxID=2593957 RepID=UPI001178A818|nr:DoxX family protein [Chitinophaga vietnamensis]
MKATKITYWIATTLIALMMLYSASVYLTSDMVKQGFQHLGYPDHFRIELAIAKIVGVVLLLAPAPAKLREWAYAGFTFTFIAAFVAHSSAGDPIANRLMPLIFLGVLAVSYFTRARMAR